MRSNPRLNYNSNELNEDELLRRLYLLPDGDLRRHVAQMVWFDCCDQVRDEKHLDKIKSVADPEGLEDSWAFNEDELVSALQIIGYRYWQIKIKLKVFREHESYQYGQTEKQRFLKLYPVTA